MNILIIDRQQLTNKWTLLNVHNSHTLLHIYNKIDGNKIRHPSDNFLGSRYGGNSDRFQNYPVAQGPNRTPWFFPQYLTIVITLRPLHHFLLTNNLNNQIIQPMLIHSTDRKIHFNIFQHTLSICTTKSSEIDRLFGPTRVLI